MVLDAETLEPLPYAHILRNQQSAITPNQSGSFMVHLSEQDTLTVSHVSYISQSLIISKGHSSDTINLAVFLERAINFLPELEVTPFPASLKHLKTKIMEIEVKDPLQSLRRQQVAITYDIIMSPKVSFDSYENFRRMNQPTEFILFSTGPNKGIGKILRKLGVGKRRK